MLFTVVNAVFYIMEYFGAFFKQIISSQPREGRDFPTPLVNEDDSSYVSGEEVLSPPDLDLSD